LFLLARRHHSNEWSVDGGGQIGQIRLTQVGE